MADKNTATIPVKEIISRYLRMHGFDGLCNKFECGCFLADFLRCDAAGEDCIPGYAAKNEDGDNIIQSEKPR